MGYLGKISAIVSANTGDYVRKLNDSARTTTAFAKTVQSDLNKASSDARRSFDAILTPLQRFERAIQNAAGYKLKFRGADVAIQSIRDLTVLVSKLERQRDIDFAVKASGLKNITELKAALTSISQDSMDIVARVGLKGLVEARAKLDEIKEVDGQKITVVLDAKKAAEYDAAIAAYNALGGQKAVEALIRVVGRDQLRQAVGLEKQLVSVAEEINAPLAAATRRYERLGAAIQVAFGPALKNAQGGVDGLKNSLDQGEKVSRSTFASVRKEALLTAAAINRIADAEEMAGRLAGGPARGRRPEFARAISRAETLQNAAMESSGGNFSGALSRQAAAARAVVVAMTEVEAAQRTAGADVAAANAEYKRRLAILVQIGDQIEKQLAVEKQRSAASKSRQDVAFAVTGKPQNIAQAEQAYNGLLSKVQQLDLAQRKAFAPKLKTLGALVAAGDAASLKDIRRLVAEIDRDLAKQKRLDVSTAEATKKIDDLRERLRGVSDRLSGTVSDPFARLEASAERAKQAVEKVRDARRRASLEGRIARVDSANAADAANDSLTPRQLAARARRRAAQLDRIADSAETKTPADVFGPAINSAARRLEVLRGSVSSVRSELDGLPAPIRRGFVSAIRDAEREFVRLSNAPAATAAAVARAEARVESLRRAVQRASASQTFAKDFGGAGQQGLSLGIDQRSLRGVGAQIEYLQGRLVGLSAVARGPVVAAMERVRQVAATGFRDGTIGTAAFNRQLQNATSNLTRVAAAALNVRPGRLAEQLRRVGDVARGSFGNMGLAIQQGIFAFDDFFSVTGSLDQRIRAAGNNISQLGFIVGGTYGLIAGVAVSAVAQLTVGMLRWLGVTEDATNATKAMNSAIDSQRDKAKELADAYREVADSIAKAGLSKSGQSLLGQQQAAAGRQRQGEEAAIEAAASRSPRLAAARGLRDLEARNRQEATTIEGVLRAAARERTADEAVRRREAGILARARLAVDQNPSIDQARAAQIRNRERLAQAEGVDANEFTGDGRRRRRIAMMRERDAELEARVQIARQRAAEGLVGAGQGVEARLGPLSQKLDEVGFTQAGRRIDDIFRSISDAMRDFQSGAMSQESLKRFIAGLALASSEAEAAARPVLAFAESLKRLASGMARDAEESAGSLEKQLRNDANRLTGEGGANDPRTVAARDSAARASQVRSNAAIERLAIERDEARMRSQFEANLASGRGPAAAVDIARRMAVQDSILRSEESSPALKERARLAVEEYSLQLNEFVAALPEAAALKARSDALAASVAEFAKSVSDGAKAAEDEVAIRKALADRANPQGDVLRGLDLIERPVDAAFREIRQRVADFRAAADRVGLANNDRRDGLERILNDERRQVAPAWFSMMEEVQNAVLSGPSRAALNASDASSVEGQRELNRLLRGEDSARDTNLVELEKQTEELRKLNDMIRAHGVAVAN